MSRNSGMLASMKAGGFYNRNSSVQGGAAEAALPLIRQAATRAAEAALGQQASETIAANGSHQSPEVLNRTFWVAEFGCSQGANSVRPMREVLAQLREQAVLQVPDGANMQLEVSVVHNDLPCNEFSQLLALIHDPQRTYLPTAASAAGEDGIQMHVFPYTLGRSMYEHLFQSGSMNLGFSFSNLHWMPSHPVETCEFTNEAAAAFPSLVPFLPTTPVRSVWLKQASRAWLRWLQLRATEAAGPGSGIVVVMPVMRTPVAQQALLSAGAAAQAPETDQLPPRFPSAGSNASCDTVCSPSKRHSRPYSTQASRALSPYGALGAYTSDNDGNDQSEDTDSMDARAAAELLRHSSTLGVRYAQAGETMVSAGKLSVREVSRMANAMFLPDPDEFKAVLDQASQVWRTNHFSTKLICHPAYSQYLNGEISVDELAGKYVDWWRAVCEPSMVNGFIRARNTAMAEGQGQQQHGQQQQSGQQQQQQQSAEELQAAAHAAVEGVFGALRDSIVADPFPLVVEFCYIWLERV